MKLHPVFERPAHPNLRSLVWVTGLAAAVACGGDDSAAPTSVEETPPVTTPVEVPAPPLEEVPAVAVEETPSAQAPEEEAPTEVFQVEMGEEADEMLAGLIEPMGNPELAEDIRIWVVAQVGAIPGTGATAALAKVLDDEQPAVRRAAIDALAERRDEAVDSALQQASTHSDPYVAEKARARLAELGG